MKPALLHLRGLATLALLAVSCLNSVPAHAMDTAESEMVGIAPVKLSASARRSLDQDRTVRVKVYVDSLGRAQKVIVVSGLPGSGLDEAVKQAALVSTYKPGQRDGKPVPGCITKDYHFSKLL